MTTPEIIALVSAIVAFGSLITAFIVYRMTKAQFEAIRNHNRLSVIPKLNMKVNLLTTDHHCKMVLMNNGIGPAILKDLSISVNGEQVEQWAIDKAVAKIFSRPPAYKYERLVHNLMIPARESITLLTADFALPAPTASEMETALRKAQITVKYESLYKEEFCHSLS